MGLAGRRVGIDLYHEVSQFLFDEAALMDERRFDEWITLFDEDLHYWMPVRTARFPREMDREFEGETGSAYFDESFDQLRQRVRKLATGRSWSETPPSRTRHIIGNLRVFTTEDDDECVAHAHFWIYRTRGETYSDTFAGSREDLVRRQKDGTLRIARRHILLDQTVLLANNLSHFF
ncbi:3-phenylpropionate/cinnamic acid dioxygenase subunit beta [Streptomyces sp. GbtcB6]|uniref:3-phenylpropionate/cinnamic acid dioxygenase subunit beta n=1 Tax=Streptomyces sp. GbtcB6 TaxID=2824751 RepID=UPI0020C619DB|nr:3-phenylpropionate/cinnamic acid dioxygenase subunit beta [Streptomyces sp. GbtcB6]